MNDSLIFDFFINFLFLFQYANDILYSNCVKLSKILEQKLIEELIQKNYINFTERPQVQLVLLTHTLFSIPSLKSKVIPLLNLTEIQDLLVLQCDEVVITACLVLFRLLIEDNFENEMKALKYI